MEIKPEDIQWELFTKCLSWNEKNVDLTIKDKCVNNYYNCDNERRCDYGKYKYPFLALPAPNAKKGKIKWIEETCYHCKGTGLYPTDFAINLFKSLNVIRFFIDPTCVGPIDAKNIPWEFQYHEKYGGY